MATATRAISIIISLNDNLSKGMNKIGRNLSLTLTPAMIALGASSIKATNDFNQAMGKVGTLLAKFGDEKAVGAINSMKEGVLDLAVTMGRSSKDIADGLFWVVSAFPPEKAEDIADSMEKLNIVTKAAVAGQTDVTNSLNLLSAVTKAYGDTSNEALQKVSDLAFKTNELGQTSYPEMGNAIQKVAALSAQLGVSQESLFGSFAALTGVTGDANEVAVQLRGILNGLLKPTSEMGEAMAYFKINTDGITEIIKEQGLLAALKELKDRFGGTEQEMAKLFPRVRAILAAFALTGNQFEEFDEKYRAMFESAGLTNDALRIQEDIINKSGKEWRKLKEAFFQFQLMLGEKLLPAFTSITSGLTKFIMGINKATPATKKFTVFVVGLLAVLGPLIAIMGPTGWLIAGIALLTGAIVTIGENFLSLESKMSKAKKLTKEISDGQKKYREQLQKTKSEIDKLTSAENDLNRELTRRMGFEVIKNLAKMSKGIMLPSEQSKLTLKSQELATQIKGFNEQLQGMSLENYEIKKISGIMNQLMIERSETEQKRFVENTNLKSLLELLAVQHYKAGTSIWSLNQMGVHKEFTDQIMAPHWKEWAEKLDKIDENTKNTADKAGKIEEHTDPGKTGKVRFFGGPVTLMNENLFGRTVGSMRVRG